MTEVDFLAVHGLAVRKAAGTDGVASLLGTQESEVAAALERAVDAGRVIGSQGKFMVAPAGQAWLSESYPVVYAEAREDEEMLAAYERFEKLNTDLLSLMTDWQTMPAGETRVSNDHADADYDAKIVDRLGALHERAERVIGRAAGVIPRLGTHYVRLEAAHDRVLGGETDFFSGVRIDSYHTVWFELHEDLLRILGMTRKE